MPVGRRVIHQQRPESKSFRCCDDDDDERSYWSRIGEWYCCRLSFVGILVHFLLLHLAFIHGRYMWPWTCGCSHRHRHRHRHHHRNVPRKYSVLEDVDLVLVYFVFDIIPNRGFVPSPKTTGSDPIFRKITIPSLSLLLPSFDCQRQARKTLETRAHAGQPSAMKLFPTGSEADRAD